MGKGASVPDPAETASAEAAANRVNQYRPDGSAVIYGYHDPNTGTFVDGAPPGSGVPQYGVRLVESPYESMLRQYSQTLGMGALSTIAQPFGIAAPSAAQAALPGGATQTSAAQAALPAMAPQQNKPSGQSDYFTAMQEHQRALAAWDPGNDQNIPEPVAPNPDDYVVEPLRQPHAAAPAAPTTLAKAPNTAASGSGSAGNNTLTAQAPDYSALVRPAAMPRLSDISVTGLPNPYVQRGSGVPQASGLVAAVPRATQAGDGYRMTQSPAASRDFTGLAMASGLLDQAGDRQLLDRAGSSNLMGRAGGGSVESVTNDIYGTMSRLMQRDMVDQDRRLQTDLQSRGLPVGGDAWNSAVRAQEQGQADALARVALDADAAGRQEDQRRFGNLQSEEQRGFGNMQSETARLFANQQGETERLLSRAVGEDQRGFSNAVGEDQRGFSNALTNWQARGQEDDRQFAQQMQEFSARTGEDSRRFGQEMAAWQARVGEDERLYNRELSAYGTAANEQSRLFGLAAQEAQQFQAAQQAAVQAQEAQRASRLGELYALLSGQYNPGAVQLPGSAAALNPTAAYAAQAQADQAKAAQTGQAAQTAASMAMLGYLALSARSAKAHLGAPGPMLEKLRGLEVARWRYREDPQQQIHIGPFAEDVAEATGFGDGFTLNLLDMVGMLLKALQELADRVDHLSTTYEAEAAQ